MSDRCQPSGWFLEVILVVYDEDGCCGKVGSRIWDAGIGIFIL